MASCRGLIRPLPLSLPLPLPMVVGRATTIAASGTVTGTVIARRSTLDGSCQCCPKISSRYWETITPHPSQSPPMCHMSMECHGAVHTSNTCPLACCDYRYLLSRSLSSMPFLSLCPLPLTLFLPFPSLFSSPKVSLGRLMQSLVRQDLSAFQAHLWDARRQV
jgi:hypothetical protein